MKSKNLSTNVPAPRDPNPNPVPQPDPPDPEPQPGPNTPQPAQPAFVARAVFSGDPIAYYITTSDDIVAINPQTQQPVLIGKKIPPTVAGFAWMYATSMIVYGVTGDGRIFNRDQFGNPFQVGYVTAR
jgi:hypothetical protein